MFNSSTINDINSKYLIASYNLYKNDLLRDYCVLRSTYIRPTYDFSLFKTKCAARTAVWVWHAWSRCTPLRCKMNWGNWILQWNSVITNSSGTAIIILFVITRVCYNILYFMMDIRQDSPQISFEKKAQTLISPPWMSCYLWLALLVYISVM